MDYRYDKPRPGRRIKRFVTLFLGALIVCASLAAVTLFVDPVAALAGSIAALWVALLVSIRHNRSVIRRSDAYIETVKDKYDSIIGVLCGALYLEDDMNVNHKSRVSRLSTTIAMEMGMRGDEIRLLQKASILADIGKIDVAQGIVSKPAALTDEEWKEMKRHPKHGYEILHGIPALRDAADIVLSQRERYDGQGYPRGLKSEDIPLGARIFALADAYCAMTSDRPYRKKMAHEMAVQEILRNSLTQFDPEVVRAFVRCEERGLLDDTTGPPQQAVAIAPGVASAA